MGLLDIPPEIFEWIAEYCDPEDLPAIRLVCHDADSKVMKTYLAEFFEVRSYYITEAHLKRAIDIAKHPVLGRSLYTLNFLLDEVSDETRDLDSAAAASRLRHARRAQKAMRDNEVDVQLLATLFSQLKLAKEPPAVTLMEAFPEDPQNHLAPGELTYCAKPDISDIRPIRVFMQALALSKMDTKWFQVDMDSWCIPLHKLVFDNIAMMNMQDALSKIEYLALDIWSDRSADGSTMGKKLGEMLSKLPMLVRLSLEHGGQEDPRVAESSAGEAFVRGFCAQRYPVLEDLRLCGFQVKYEDLERFLHVQASDGKLHKFTGLLLKVSGWQRRVGLKHVPELAEALKLSTGIEEISL